MAKVTTAKEIEGEIQARLAAPFDPSEVRWKVQTVSGNRCLAVAYVDARAVMDRLDETLGVNDWQDRYTVIDSHSVSCRLRVRFGSEWITKEDVGSESEQPDEGDRRKAAYSDALKRVAVKFGIGRYLYRLPRQWVDYDPAKKQMLRVPALPDWAAPKQRVSPKTPKTGQELKARLIKHDLELANAGRCKPGELIAYVTAAGVRVGHPADIAQWDGMGVDFEVKTVKDFVAQHPAQAVAS
jgi:hypothetical protein